MVTPGQVFRWGLAAAAGFAAVVVAIMALWTVRSIIVLALIALFIAVSLDAPVRWLVRRKLPRPVAVTLVVSLAVIVAGGIVALVATPLIQEASRISVDIPGYVADLERRSETFRELSEQYGVDEHLNELAATLPERIGASVLDFFRRFLGVLASTLLVLVLAIYFVADLPRLRNGLQRLAPARYRERTRRIVDVVVDKVGSYLVGSLMISAVAGVVAYIGLSILRVPFALPLALLVAATALIPLIGATLGAVACVAVAGIAGGFWSGVLVAVLFVLYQQLENYLIAPRIMQYSMNLSAVAVLLAGLTGAVLLGLVGALMAIPIAAAVKAVYAELRPDQPEP